MIATLLILSLLLGLDSFAVGASLGTLQPSPSRRRWLAASFGLCDGLAGLVGSFINLGAFSSSALASSEWLGPAAVGGYGLYVLYLSWRSRRLWRDTTVPAQNWFMFWLPLCLSLDNLAAGATLGDLGLPAVLAAVTMAAVSGLMACAGLRLGHAIGRRLPIGADIVGGSALVTLAVVFSLVRA
jgi:putative Mn2+ efflux pump MntP